MKKRYWPEEVQKIYKIFRAQVFYLIEDLCFEETLETTNNMHFILFTIIFAMPENENRQNLQNLNNYLLSLKDALLEKEQKKSLDKLVEMDNYFREYDN